jgi:hypothetical protein
MNLSYIKAVVFDPHSWSGNDEFCFHSNGKTFFLNKVTIGDKPKDASIVFFADEYAGSALPLFFPRNRRVALLKESPICTKQISTKVLQKRFDLVLTHREDLIQIGLPFVRVDLSLNFVGATDNLPVHFCKSKLVSFIGSIEHQRENGYALRSDVWKALRNSDAVDCFGRGIKVITRKNEALEDYCFSVAMENAKENFYYTEKIIDCFLTYTVPIYWGCPKIDSVFDGRGILSFDTVDELLRIINNLTIDKYRKMLPYVMENRKRCFSLGLESFEKYMMRCIKTAASCLNMNSKPMHRACVASH